MENQEFFEQHPIPQQISSYQFRLVGDMTLKQFFQVGGGALLSIIIYASNFPSIIKWPLVITSFFLGIGLAFLPIQDRPLEKWIFAFFRSIYSPTIFRWKSTGKPYVFYQSESVGNLQTTKVSPKTQPDIVKTAPVDNQQAEILSAQVQLDKKESDFFGRITSLFGGGKTTSVADQQILMQAPDATAETQTPSAVGTKYAHIQSPSNMSLPAQNIPIQTHVTDVTTSVSSSTPQNQTIPIQQAQYSSDAAPPLPPTAANILVGQVLTNDGKIVDNAILEIRDSDGRPARAVKTNKLGHFAIVTPLVNGEFQIITEKDGFQFDPVKIEVSGNVIPPIVVRGLASANQDVSIETNQ